MELLGLGSRYTLLNPSLRTYLTNGFELQGECYQFAEKFAYGHGTLGRNYHEVRIKPVFSTRRLNFVYFRFACCKAPLCHSAIWPKRTKRISHPVRFISGDLIWQIVTISPLLGGRPRPTI